MIEFITVVGVFLCVLAVVAFLIAVCIWIFYVPSYLKRCAVALENLSTGRTTTTHDIHRIANHIGSVSRAIEESKGDK